MSLQIDVYTFSWASIVIISSGGKNDPPIMLEIHTIKISSPHTQPVNSLEHTVIIILNDGTRIVCPVSGITAHYVVGGDSIYNNLVR